MGAELQTWKVMTAEGLFETDLDTLRQWISEGCVLPTDKVTRGNMKWIEAGRAPMLRDAFNGEIKPYGTETVPAQETAVNDELPPPPLQSNHVQVHHGAPLNENAVCQNHPETAAKYFCHGCGATFCGRCPKSVNLRIVLCPVCDEFLKPYEEIRKKSVSNALKRSKFGLVDLGRALQYPLKHLPALIFGGVLYGLLQLAGLKGWIIAWVLMFGCMAHVISQVAWGRLNKSFMPESGSFSVLDDVATPIGMGIGITIVTWGPTIVLMVVMLFGIAGKIRSTQSEIISATETQQPQLASRDGDGKVPDAERGTNGAVERERVDGEPRSAYGVSDEPGGSGKPFNDPSQILKNLPGLLAVGIVFVLLFLVTMAWGFFYYPMALAVAGYTERFTSVINPLVGLDTIRRMGLDYFKAFGMVVVLQIVGLIVSLIVAIILLPFGVPLIGNLPAKFVNGGIAFYFNLVIACILGLALFKNAEKLGIETD